MSEIEIEKVSKNVYKIPKKDGMNVPARVYASEQLLEAIKGDKTLQQIKNVAHLPGIQKFAAVMPDGHQGYGFPIGGVAALDTEKGGISPGGVGYDINCGVKVVKTDIEAEKIYDRAEQLANILYQKIPSGTGKGGIADISSDSEFDEVLEKGLEWAKEEGYATEKDVKRCEDGGKMEEADASKVSEKAKNRGRDQVGSLGSGNHFLEIQKVEEVYDKKVAEEYGLEKGKALIMIHCGSRGLGHQICSDYVRRIEKERPELIDELPDKELAYAPGESALAEDYFGAMASAVNFAWANRQVIASKVRESFERIFNQSWEELGMEVLYDVAHNVAKKEKHKINGEEKEVYIHRKGSTRAFPPGREEVPDKYRDVGQPIILPGSMGTSSYILKGGEKSLNLSFGSTAHGAGRLMSRTKAKDKYWGEDVQKELKRDKILVKAQSGSTIAEEAPGAYKDVDEVVKVSDQLGIGNKVVRLKPIANIKG
ncbi:MAG: RtcB family protein [Candidatus Nanohaloarchaeota archaeon QJJ-9]|nr:RtcB family protein [Candidatus Nanohaloarchaeota archaeon QJJ-9]